jgi:hypothetical protein
MCGKNPKHFSPSHVIVAVARSGKIGATVAIDSMLGARSLLCSALKAIRTAAPIKSSALDLSKLPTKPFPF